VTSERLDGFMLVPELDCFVGGTLCGENGSELPSGYILMYDGERTREERLFINDEYRPYGLLMAT
jgi:hypothetical protein